jgi:parallel beta-helix repeat protein
MSYAAVSITNEIYGTLNPISYGARPNDLVDDSDAFQKCLNEAKKRKGSKLVIPPGEYIIAKELIINETENLFIEGAGALLRKPEGNGSNIIYGNYNKQITIRDLSFEGERINNFKEQWPQKMNACAILGRSSGIRFENCVVKNFHYGVCFGTSTDNGYDVWVIDCQFFNCNSDVDLYGKPSLHISGNVSHGCTGHSIQIEPPYKRDDSIQDYTEQPKIDALSVGNIVSENVIVGCKGIGIIVFGGSENVSVVNNQIINYGMCGILLHAGAKNIQIKGNTISNSLYAKNNDRPWKDSGAGLVVLKVRNAIVEGNIISHPNTGVYASGTNGAIISNNKIDNAKDAGICLYNSNMCELNGNVIVDFNQNKSWWANSGIVINNSQDISIFSTTIKDANNNSFSVYSSNSENVIIKDLTGIGYKTSMTYPATLFTK